jgi:hypothetical protein
MSEFDVRGEVNVQNLRLFLDEDRVLRRTADRGATGPEIQELRIGGRPVPLEAFYRIPREPVGGEELGWVNLPWEEGNEWGGGDGLHVVWLNRDGESRRALVPASPPPGADIDEWAANYRRLESLPQLFIGP